MESLVHYSNPSHALSVLGVLNEQRLRGQMCDTMLVVGNQKYHVHRSVLAASSEYFQSLFTQMDEEDLKVVHLDFCEPDAFEIVLNYIYSSSLFLDKGGLVAIQELGYSLGIPFLTNIASAVPQASYCVSRKRLCFSEEDGGDGQTRSVIVCHVQSETSVPGRSVYRGKTSERAASPRPAREVAEPPSTPNSHRTSIGSNSQSVNRKSAEIGDTQRKSAYQYSSVLKGKQSLRPQLTSSVSFSDMEMQHTDSQPGAELDNREEEEEDTPLHHARAQFRAQAAGPSQTIDRSGPLIKSLLRRSLSMDSPVPVFSPTLELKELQSREQSVVKLASKVTGPHSSEHNGSSKKPSPLILRSKYPRRYNEGSTQVEGDVCVKAEPSSPLADPLEIIRITVGETLPVNLKDFQTNYDQGSRPDFDTLGKRKSRADNRRYPFKKSRALNEHHPPPDYDVPEMAPQGASMDSNDTISEQRLGKLFKCWNCLKVFRSSAGLHRHVNMYHNPDKPYACEICHKRFHTNFKVWTHCQTQHGVVQNPASSSSSSVLDEKFQKKLIDMVQEREIKKALLWKLKRNKQVLQSPKLAKNRSRTNSICPYCGKVFLFHSQYKQHLRTHAAEEAEQITEAEGELYQDQEAVVQQTDTDAEDYPCRLCNMKLSSVFEQGDHERGCRHATVCPYCGLRFSNTTVKRDHEAHCKYKKLTCLECMRTFKSSFSIWRHQVEVHNHNVMTVKDQMNLKEHEGHEEEEEEEEESEMLPRGHYSPDPTTERNAGENIAYSRSPDPPMYDSEDSSSFVPEDLSMGHFGKLVVKEEPMEEAVCETANAEAANNAPEELGVRPCEKCGNLFSSHKDLERHQELLCHIKPFICQVCNKAFRTNFRLWSHFQSHMSTADDAGAKDVDRHRPSSLSPSPPPTPQTPGCHTMEALVPKPAQRPDPPSMTAAAAEEPGSPEPSSAKRPEAERQQSDHGSLLKSNSLEAPQESETLFYHAPPLSALTFKRQYMCKLCHRTFKTAFSLWSHEQSHGHL